MYFVDKVISQLRAIKWDTKTQHATTESVEYARVYLSQFAGFVREFRAGIYVNVSAFTSPAQILGLGENLLSKSAMEECESLLGQSTNAYDIVYAKHALEWAVLCDLSHPATCGREHLFEPLLHLIVNRVPAIIRKGYWVVDENMFPLLNWEARYGTSQN